MDSITKTVYVGDERVEFPRLTVADLLQVQDGIVSFRERVADQLAKEKKLNAYDAYNLTLGLRTKRPSLVDVVSYALTPDGAMDLLDKSLAKAKVEKSKRDEIVAKMNNTDVVVLARMLAEGEVEQPEDRPQPPLSASQSTSSS